MHPCVGLLVPFFVSHLALVIVSLPLHLQDPTFYAWLARFQRPLTSVCLEFDQMLDNCLSREMRKDQAMVISAKNYLSISSCLVFPFFALTSQSMM